MKVAIISPNIDFIGGAEKVAINLAKHLSAKYQVEIISVFQNNKGQVIDPISNVVIKRLNLNEEKNFIKRFYQRVTLFARLKNELKDYDIIIGNLFFRYFAMPFFSKVNGKIIEIQHMGYNENYIERKGLMLSIRKKIMCFSRNFIYKKLTKVVILTKKDEKLFNENKVKNTCVIPNALPIVSEEKSQLKNKNIIAIGRLTSQKGFDMLIKAWEKVREINSEWTLNIYGEGPLRKELEEQIKSLKLESSVNLCGLENNIKDKILDSSIFALSSRFEGFPLVLLELMSLGVPGVAFNCNSGPNEIITNGNDSFVVEQNNIKEMAEKLLFLMENEEERIKMGKNAKFNMQRYRWEEIIKQWQELFEEIQNEGIEKL
jgi:glycosyltransferase involved in cell wall biosynthesis